MVCLCYDGVRDIRVEHALMHYRHTIECRPRHNTCPPPPHFPLPRRSHVRYARPDFPPSDAGGLFNTKHFTHQDNSNKHSLPYIRCTLALAALAFFKTVFFTYESSSTEKLTACLLHRRRTTPAYRKSEPRIFHGNDR